MDKDFLPEIWYNRFDLVLEENVKWKRTTTIG